MVYFHVFAFCPRHVFPDEPQNVQSTGHQSQNLVPCSSSVNQAICSAKKSRILHYEHRVPLMRHMKCLFLYFRRHKTYKSSYFNSKWGTALLKLKHISIFKHKSNHLHYSQQQQQLFVASLHITNVQRNKWYVRISKIYQK